MPPFTRFPRPRVRSSADSAGFDPLKTCVSSQSEGDAKRCLRPQTPNATIERLNPLVTILIVSLIIPIYFSFGSIKLNPNRLILLVTVLPLLFGWAIGKAGKIRITDILVILSSVWVAVTLLVYGGTSMVQNAGVTAIEILAPYFMARRFIRSQAQYLILVRILFLTVLFLVLIAGIEAVTGVNIILTILDPIFLTFPPFLEYRWGMQRAKTGFEHPILYGCFVAFMFSPVFFSFRLRMGALKAFLVASPVMIATFFSLSAGAYLGLMVQLLLIGWGLITGRVGRKWQVLGSLVLLAFMIVDLISNRSPFEVFISYLTFDAHTSYWRILIFIYGMENVWAHPFFGIGLGDWMRPDWMYTSTVDNFWLVIAMRHGFPGFILFLMTYLSALSGLMRARPADDSVKLHRNALCFSLIGLGISIATVHLWGASFVFYMFVLGAGSWMTDAPTTEGKILKPYPR